MGVMDAKAEALAYLEAKAAKQEQQEQKHHSSCVKHDNAVRSGRCLVRGVQGVKEGAGFGEDVFGAGAGEGPAEDALGGELGSAFGVAADEAHEGAGVDGTLTR